MLRLAKSNTSMRWARGHWPMTEPASGPAPDGKGIQGGRHRSLVAAAGGAGVPCKPTALIPVL